MNHCIYYRQSQNLKQQVTEYSKFLSSDDKIYIKFQQPQNKVLGFVRVGPKTLFYFDSHGPTKLDCQCVLDIYVDPSFQRMGIGKELFDFFLNNENVQPRRLAYDRPSPKLMAFLSKHYKLNQYLPQANNFVIFNDYFLSGSPVQSLHSPAKVQLAKQQQKMYEQVERMHMSKTMSGPANQTKGNSSDGSLTAFMESSANSQQNFQNYMLKDMMYNSGKINNAFHSFHKLAFDRPNPITNSYASTLTATGMPQRTTIDVKADRDAELIYSSQLRGAKADQELQFLKASNRQLSQKVKGPFSFGQAPASNQIGRFFKI